MTAFRSLPPARAIEAIEAAGIAHAATLLRDYAAAGLMKSYALVLETIEVTGQKACIRGGTVPSDVWQRIVDEGGAGDVWAGGTVRLEHDGLVGGRPAVRITGISFNPTDVRRLIAIHAGAPAIAEAQPAPPSTLANEPQTTAAAMKQLRRVSAGIRPGALVATVDETASALSCGRTSVYQMLKDGRLERAPSNAGTRIYVASIHGAIGISC